MKAFMEMHFPTVDARYTVIHLGSWKEKGKHRKMTGVGLIDVGNPDIREMLMKIIESKDLQLPSHGKNLNLRRAKTQSASDRDMALVKAAELLKKQPGTTDVCIEWAGSRGVKVAGVYAYSQAVGKDVGNFVGTFAQLQLR